MFRPARSDHEHQEDYDAEEHPPIDQVIDADGEPVAGQMAEHDNQIGTHPVGDDGHQEGNDNEDDPSL